MLYILGIILPPIALFVVGKPIQAIFNLIIFVLSGLIFIGTLGFGSFLSFPLWIVAVIHALFVVHGHNSDKKIERIADAVAQRSGGDASE